MILTQDDTISITEARTAEAVVVFMLAMLDRRTTKFSLICGPRSTGNDLSSAENYRRAQRVTAFLRRHLITNVFDPEPFFHRIEIIRGKRREEDRDYFRENVYLPLLRSPWLEAVRMVFEWRHSIDAKWIHDQAKEIPGIKTTVLQIKWTDGRATKTKEQVV